MGLAPLLVHEIFQVIQEINAAGTTILLVEQNANMALSIAHRAYVLETGQIVLSRSGQRNWRRTPGSRRPISADDYAGHLEEVWKTPDCQRHS